MTRKRHLLHVFSTFKVGGPQMRFATLVGALGRDFCHSVIAMDGNYAAADSLPPDTDVTLLRGQRHRAFLPFRLLDYRRAVARIAPDLLVTYNWGAIEWVVANARSAVPDIHIVDGFGPEEAVRRSSRRNALRRLSLALAEAVVVPSLTLQALALGEWNLDPARVHYIPNGIFPEIPMAADIDLPAGKPRIAWAGAMRTEKNIERLLHAFVPLKDRAILLCIGDGPERAPAEGLARTLGIADQTHFLGHQRNVTGLLAQVDIVALSSDTEQMPMVVLEAMAAGRAVVSVDVGDVRAMLSAENRPFVTAKTAEALSVSLAALLDDPALAADIGAANRAHLEKTYHIDRMVGAYRDLFTRLSP